MAFRALRPCSRIMRGSPHQSDLQQKEAYFLLEGGGKDEDEEEEEEEEEGEEDDDDEGAYVAPHRASFSGEEPRQQLLSRDPSSRKELPTFVALQGSNILKLQQKKDVKTGVGHASACFKKDNRHLVPFCEEQTFTATMPSSEPRKVMCKVSSVLEPKPRKKNAEHDRHSKQTMSCKKLGCASNNTHGLTLERAMFATGVMQGGEKKRRSSASARDMIDADERIERFCDGKSSSWEEEVRQAMARSSMGRKQTDEAWEGGSAGGLHRSNSVKDYGYCTGGSALPPSLIVKRMAGGGKVDAAVCTSESGAKLMEDIEVGGRVLHRKSFAEEKGMWKAGLNVKSPGEEKWEEAAEDEERQDMQRRAKSQSMRYDTSRAAEVANISGCDAHTSSNPLYNDEDPWAVYKRSGYVNARPHTSSVVAAPCCSSLLGRSLSMRDTRMGLVMECAACGAGGRLLCFCSCCAAARGCAQAAPLSVKKRGGSGSILRACRRLLGLDKKHPSNPSNPHLWSCLHLPRV